MNMPELLAELRQENIRVWMDGERLRCRIPNGVLTPRMHARLRECKDELREFLRSAEKLAQTPRSIVPLQPLGSRPPVFAVAGHNGDVFCYRLFARELGPEQPFYGLQPPGLDGKSKPLARIEDLAAYFAAHIRDFRPGQPCLIAGFCAGGTVALELARQLPALGQPVHLLALFGCPFPTSYRWLARARQAVRTQFNRVVARLGRTLAGASAGPAAHTTPPARATRTSNPSQLVQESDLVVQLRIKVQRATLAAARRYRPGPFAGRISQFLPSRDWLHSGFAPLRWRALGQSAEEHFGPDGCTSAQMLREPYAHFFAQLFRQCCQRLVEHPRSKL